MSALIRGTLSPAPVAHRAGRCRPGRDVTAGPAMAPLLAADLVHVALRRGDDVERAVRALLDVRRDAEVLAEEQRLALGDLVLAEVVGDAVLAGACRRRRRPSCGCSRSSAGRGCRRAARRGRSRRTDRPCTPCRAPWSSRKSMPPGATSYFQVISGIGELRAGELEQAVVGVPRRVGDVDRVPAELLEAVVAAGRVRVGRDRARGSSRSP